MIRETTLESHCNSIFSRRFLSYFKERGLDKALFEDEIKEIRE